MRWSVVVALAVATGCTSDNAVVEQSGSDVWYQEPTNEVDILFVVDDLQSMAEEQDNLAEGFANFIGEIEATGTDFRIAVITTSFDYANPDRGEFVGPVITTEDDYLNVFRDQVHVGTNGSDKEKGLEAAAYALSPTLTTGANAGFLRQDAFLMLVFVSDENDCSDEGALEGMNAESCDQDELLVPVTEYVADFRSLKDDDGKVQIGAVVGPEASAGCTDAKPGFRYQSLSQYMGGVVGDICDTQYDTVMYDLGLNASGVRTSFQLSHGAKEGTLEIYIDESLVLEDLTKTDGWTYDEENYYVTFWGNAIPPRGATVVANYTIQPGT